MAHKKPPYTHRQMAELLFKTSGPFESKRSFIPTWLKIEAYTLFFTVLPQLIMASACLSLSSPRALTIDESFLLLSAWIGFSFIPIT